MRKTVVVLAGRPAPSGFVVTSHGLGGGGTFSGTLTTTLDGVTFASPTS